MLYLSIVALQQHPWRALIMHRATHPNLARPDGYYYLFVCDHRDRSRRSRAAFSLTELAIVVLIMGIFGAVTAPKFFDSLLFHRVELAARRVKSDLELVRQTARLTSTQQTLTVIGLTYSTSAAVTDLDRPTQAYSLDFSKPPYSLNALSANFGGQTEVHFNGYGLPSSGGTVIVQAKNHQCTVTLDGATGQVSITSNHTGGRTAKVSGI
jgi:type II secretory pathway pseudopilin PulG